MTRKLKSLGILLVVALLFPGPGAAQSREGRLFLVFVDDLHLDFRSTPRVRELLKKTMRLLIQDDDEIGLVTSGVSSVSVKPTADLERITTGMSRITGNALRADQIVDPEQALERIAGR